MACKTDQTAAAVEKKKIGLDTMHNLHTYCFFLQERV